jgi:hypothetical protein
MTLAQQAHGETMIVGTSLLAPIGAREWSTFAGPIALRF